MKWALVLAATLMVGQPALAAGHYQAGIEGFTPAQQPSEPLTQTEKLLKRQAQSGAPEQSELPSDLYVKSQKRLSDSFTHAIPEDISKSTRQKQN